eukprot:IDg23042t1
MLVLSNWTTLTQEEQGRVGFHDNCNSDHADGNAEPELSPLSPGPVGKRVRVDVQATPPSVHSDAPLDRSNRISLNRLPQKAVRFKMDMLSGERLNRSRKPKSAHLRQSSVSLDTLDPLYYYPHNVSKREASLSGVRYWSWSELHPTELTTDRMVGTPATRSSTRHPGREQASNTGSGRHNTLPTTGYSSYQRRVPGL